MISPNHDDCSERCISNNNCRGYAAVNTTKYPNRCYLKDQTCKNNMFQKEDVTLFIPQALGGKYYFCHFFNSDLLLF